jgi:small-conductance mechanosensitive channel
MVAPLDIDRIQTELSRPSGWIELGVVVFCFAIAWWVDHRVRLRSDASSRAAKIGAGSVNRLIFPLTALVLLLIARAVLQHREAPVFMPIAIPLAIALALIRLFIYALHELFGTGRPLPASERAISFTIAGALLLYYVGILQQIRAALADARIPIGSSELSLLDLVRDLLVIVLALAASLWTSGLIEHRLLRASSGDVNARVVLAKLVRAVLILIGLLVALSMVGIDITVLSVFGGALGVGIGLGLQKLASNYIAGFTILLDRSVRLGDMITVDNRTGVVTKATARYVVVLGLDGIEAIVPNDILVTTTVLNHSYTSKDTRVAATIQVRYDSDIDLALRLMQDVALAEPRVLRAPTPPTAFVNRFGDQGIELELAVWISDPEKGQQNLRSALNRAIWKAFKAQGIEVPVPQREVRLIGGEAPPAALSSPPRGAQADSDR